MSDLVIGWLVIPGVVVSVLASVASAVWTYYSTRDLKHVESRLRRDEETYRLAQSPRVTTAIELWSALGEYERSLVAVRNPIMEVKTPPGATPADWDRLSDEHSRAQKRELRQAWSVLRAARDKAEVLLPPPVFAAFDALFGAYAKAQETQWWMDLPGNSAGQELRSRQTEQLKRAVELRPATLRELHAMLGWTAEDRT